MTSTKMIALGFLIIMVGFALLLLGTSAATASIHMPIVNLFFATWRDGSWHPDTIGIIKLEQGIGLALVIIGAVVGAAGCFRRE